MVYVDQIGPQARRLAFRGNYLSGKLAAFFMQSQDCFVWGSLLQLLWIKA